MKPYSTKRLIVIIGLILASIGSVVYFLTVKHKTTQPVNLSFYSWQNRFSLDSNTYLFLQKHRVSHLRVKLFELSFDRPSNSAVVNNYIQPDFNARNCQDFFLTNTLTPVVFIDNEIFYSIDSAAIRNMAGLVKRAMVIHSANLFHPDRSQWANIWDQLYFSLEMYESKPDSLNKAYQQFKKNIVSYEFDCDWTERTQKKYFYFLQQVKDSLQKKTEATLRLHQYKYRDKTGIPPVDGVNLMCYNMGELSNEKETNSIFDSKILAQYIKGQAPYPVPMNIALPSFSWVAVFRNKQFYKLLPSKDLESYLKDSYNVKKINETNFTVLNETYYHWSNEALQPGDHLRVEKVDTKILIQGYDLLIKELQVSPQEVIIFDLNNTSKTDDFDELAKHINP